MLNRPFFIFAPLLFVLLMSLSACGFSPVYGDKELSGENSQIRDSLNNIRLGALSNRQGQYLRNALIDRFYKDGYPASPLYQLNLSALSTRKTAFDITIESEATRYQLRMATTMTLRDIKTNTVLLKRNLYALSSYNVLESEFATRAAEESAEQAILDDLSRQIEQQLTLYLAKK